jgi:hypothetical protein
MYRVTYKPGQAFVVHLPGREVEFKRVGKLYVANLRTLLKHNAVYTTVCDNEDILYTRAEVHKAKTAYEFLKCSGYPSPEEAVHLIQDGNVFGLPDLTRQDIVRAYDIPYAPSPRQSFASQPECVSHVVNFYVHTSTGALWLYLSVQKVDPIFSHYLFCFSEFGDKRYSVEKASCLASFNIHC